MKKQWSAIGVTLAIATIALFVLFWLMVNTTSVISAPILASPLSPIVTSIAPNSASNALDTSVVISGTGFTAGMSGTMVIAQPTAYLGNAALNNVTWVNSTVLSATVPWGLVPGVYTLTVVNPDGGTGSLADAFTVTQGIGVWTTGGPYGGNVHDMAVHPAVTTTIFAVLQGAGLFRSIDGGSTWKSVRPDGRTDVNLVKYGQTTSATLYIAGCMGLYCSLDDGQTWEAIYTEADVGDFVINPLDDNIIYITQWNVGVGRTEDGGQNWEPRSTGLTSLDVQYLYIDPLTPTTLYATTNDGNVFKTLDEGGHWFTITNGLTLTLEQPFKLAINPYNPDNLWAMKGRGYVGQFARSDNGGATWEDITGPFLEMIEDVDFSTHISTTLYAGGAHELYRSIDGGDTWDFLSTDPTLRRLMIQEIALDRATGVPIYLSGGGGVYRSHDGGLTWERAVQGLAGIQPWFLLSSLTSPEMIYSIYDGDFYYSHNAGSSWGFSEDALGAMVAAFDPSDSQIGYAVGGWGMFAQTDDGGLSWTQQPVITHTSHHISAISVYPANRDVIFIGGGSNWATPPIEGGWLARSNDRGNSWQDLNIGQIISDVTSIVFDPVVTDTVYIGTCTIHPFWSYGGGSGVFKSTDGGITWNPANAGLTYRCVRDLVIHPDLPQVLLAAINDPSPGAIGVFKSTDGGVTWDPSDTGLENSQVLGLTIDPLMPSHVYAATWGGLFRSTDSGENWSRASGTFGQVPIFSVSASAYEERTIVYVGTTGGAAATSVVRQTDAVQQTLTDSAVTAGVYQIVVVHYPVNNFIYLPLVIKAK
ncbi:MAG: IPT/TIG domain-containing protein [Anaerolineae bacterium]|nr:IPT/TIG domain-containing protein [Anaerolineae bacterium]